MFFDLRVRDKLTVSFSWPWRTWWEAGRTSYPTSNHNLLLQLLFLQEKDSAWALPWLP